MKNGLRSPRGTVAVWLVVFIIAIVFFSMLATHAAGWSWCAWLLFGSAAVMTVAILVGAITKQTHFAILFAVIGALTIVLAVIIKLVL